MLHTLLLYRKVMKCQHSMSCVHSRAPHSVDTARAVISALRFGPLETVTRDWDFRS